MLDQRTSALPKDALQRCVRSCQNTSRGRTVLARLSLRVYFRMEGPQVRYPVYVHLRGNGVVRDLRHRHPRQFQCHLSEWRRIPRWPANLGGQARHSQSQHYDCCKWSLRPIGGSLGKLQPMAVDVRPQQRHHLVHRHLDCRNGCHRKTGLLAPIATERRNCGDHVERVYGAKL